MCPRCSVFIAMSLDGFIARPDGRIDWLSLVERPGEDYGYEAFFDSIDTPSSVARRMRRRWGSKPGRTPASAALSSLTTGPADRSTARSSTRTPRRSSWRGSRHGVRRGFYVDGGSVIQSFLGAAS